MSDDFRQRILDEEHLRLLRIGYFVMGGTAMIGVFIGLLYVTIGVFFSAALEGMAPRGGAQGPPPAFVGVVFAALGGFVLLLAGGYVTLCLLTARALKERRSRTLCLVTAGVSCLSIPFGTLIGVFTLMVLQRPSVQALFTYNAPPPAPPAA